MQLTHDDVKLGPVRVVAQRAIASPTPLARDWSEVQARARQAPRVLSKVARPKASFDAGGISRLNAQWRFSHGNANRDLRHNLAVMRGRSRDLERNDPYAKKFLELVETNIVGAAGISAQSRVTEIGPAPDYAIRQDALANKIIEAALADFSRRGQFEVTGKLSRSQFERLMIRTIARDGEVLVKFVTDPAYKHGVRCQMLEADWLDETYNEDRPDGSRVVMGVELAPTGQAVAYHLLKRHPGDQSHAGRERVRYTADQVKHYFLAERPEQVRGVPWMHAAMSRLYQLGEFDDSAILAARLGAEKFMVLEDAEGMAADVADGIINHGQPIPGDSSVPSLNDGTGALYFQSQKGSIDILPRGTKVADWNPNYPSDTYGPFILAALRGISSGFGVSYESLTNDRSGVTWTSIRHAVLDERDRWKTLQDWFIESWGWDFYTAWIDAALLAPQRPLQFLPAGKRDKFLAPSFHGRRWDWVNPKDDIAAKREALGLRVTSHRRVLAEQGTDLEELFAEIAEDRALAAQYGIDLDAAMQKPSKAPAPASDDTPDDNEDDPPAKPNTRRTPNDTEATA